MTGKQNIIGGLIAMSGYMILGLLFLYFYDFTIHENLYEIDKTTGKASEILIIIGFMFPVLNIIIGLILVRFPFAERSKKLISRVSLIGLVVPLGIFLKQYENLSNILILIGTAAMIFSLLVFALKLISAPNYYFQKTGDVR